jgi:hypothetical protein
MVTLTIGGLVAVVRKDRNPNTGADLDRTKRWQQRQGKAIKYVLGRLPGVVRVAQIGQQY